jgi:hypothetical protein
VACGPRCDAALVVVGITVHYTPLCGLKESVDWQGNRSLGATDFQGQRCGGFCRRREPRNPPTTTIEFYLQFAWIKSEVHQRRAKGRRISENNGKSSFQING